MDIVFVPFLTRDRFASLVGVTPDTLERWIRDGRVQTYRIGKRSLVDVRQWMRDGDKKPPLSIGQASRRETNHEP